MGKSFIHINKRPLHKQTFVILIISLFASSFTSYAQIQKEFSPRFNDMINGDFTMIANNILSRTATEDYNGESDNHSLQTMFMLILTTITLHLIQVVPILLIHSHN